MDDRGYKNYTFKVGKINSSDIILLDKKVIHPWFYFGQFLVFFHEDMASAMALSNNDISLSVNLAYC
jgi:hypothetical protein